MDLKDLREKLAQAMLDHHDRLTEIVEKLPDEDVPPLVAECRRMAGPNESHNFVIAEWHTIADVIEADFGMRLVMRDALAHMDATGSDFYCVMCRGPHTLEHLAELSADHSKDPEDG